MNIDIKNYGHYRVTSHGGRRFDLFNRKNDKVYSITAAEYRFINLAASTGFDSIEACLCVETDYTIRVVP